MDKLQRKIDILLAIILIAALFLFSAATIFPNLESLYNSATRKSRLTTFLENPDNPDLFDKLSARIASFEDRFNNRLWLKDELGYVNSSFQYALGKSMITTGATNMITLDNGGLYDMQPYIDTSTRVEEIIAFEANQTVPTLVVYEHPTVYGDGMLTGGYALLDKGDEMSDEIVSALRAGGLDVIDSRDVLTGGDYSKLILKTDQHWTPLAALEMARAIAPAIGLDSALLAPELFEDMVFEKKFMGKYGQRIGVNNIEPDDYILPIPTYDTYLTRHTLWEGEETNAEGDFLTAALKMDQIEGEGWNTTAYRAYGLREDFEHIHNPSAPEFAIVIFRDSYSAPIGVYLSLLASDVYMFDLRTCPEPAQSYIDKYQPDRVIIAYSRQMLTQNEYDLLEGY